jgi:hypothetical protein
MILSVPFSSLFFEVAKIQLFYGMQRVKAFLWKKMCIFAFSKILLTDATAS